MKMFRSTKLVFFVLVLLLTGCHDHVRFREALEKKYPNSVIVISPTDPYEALIKDPDGSVYWADFSGTRLKMFGPVCPADQTAICQKHETSELDIESVR